VHLGAGSRNLLTDKHLENCAGRRIARYAKPSSICPIENRGRART
jgi:hypothetical protein